MTHIPESATICDCPGAPPRYVEGPDGKPVRSEEWSPQGSGPPGWIACPLCHGLGWYQRR